MNFFLPVFSPYNHLPVFCLIVIKLSERESIRVLFNWFWYHFSIKGFAGQNGGRGQQGPTGRKVRRDCYVNIG